MIDKKYNVSEQEVNVSESQQEAKDPALNISTNSEIQVSAQPVNYEPNRDDYDLTRLFETEMKAKKDRQMKGYNYQYIIFKTETIGI